MPYEFSTSFETHSWIAICKSIEELKYSQQTVFRKRVPSFYACSVSSLLQNRKEREQKGVGRDILIRRRRLYVTVIMAGRAPYILPYLFTISYKPSWSAGVKKASNGILKARIKNVRRRKTSYSCGFQREQAFVLKDMFHYFL